jgi:uncharacterized protein YjgD (DUF1641 family)
MFQRVKRVCFTRALLPAQRRPCSVEGLDRALLGWLNMDDSPPVSSFSGLLESLARIEQRLARIELRLDKAESLDQLPNVVAVAVDTWDQHAAGLQARGVDLDERAKSALQLLERITEPSAVKLLTSLIELAEQAPNALAVLVDTFDERVGALDDRLDMSARAATLARIAERLTSPNALGVVETLLGHLPALDQLLGAGLLGPGPLDIVSRAGQALSQAQQELPQPIGAFGLFRALSDRDVQYALGFVMAFAREFGRSVEPSRTTHALAAGTHTH